MSISGVAEAGIVAKSTSFTALKLLINDATEYIPCAVMESTVRRSLLVQLKSCSIVISVFSLVKARSHFIIYAVVVDERLSVREVLVPLPGGLF